MGSTILTRQQITLVQESFARLAHDKARFGASFFKRLFTLDPSLEQSFAGVDMQAHALKLVAAISFAVGGLRRPETLVGPVQQLGAAHVGYGATAAHYTTAGRALLRTLSDFLEDIWTPELSAAWNAAFNEITRLMLAGAARPPSELAA